MNFRNFTNMLEADGFPLGRIESVTFSLSAAHTLGKCRRRKTSSGGYVYNITLNRAFSEDEAKFSEKIKEVFLHECIHTITGCFNHGENFRFWGEKATRKYGIPVSRLTSVPKEFFRTEAMTSKYKYEVVCLKCGQKFRMCRKTALIKTLLADDKWQTFTHQTCGGGKFWLLKSEGKDVRDKFYLSKGVTMDDLYASSVGFEYLSGKREFVEAKKEYSQMSLFE